MKKRLNRSRQMGLKLAINVDPIAASSLFHVLQRYI